MEGVVTTPDRRSAPVALPSAEFWSGKTVLLTGHTGFKGAWLSAWLRRLGANVVGVSLAGSPPAPRLWDALADLGIVEINADIARPDWIDLVATRRPEVVLHLAAQSLVPTGYREPLKTFEANVLGTARVMEYVANTPSVQATVMVTTDKVYDPRQPGPHPETDFLGGHDPYAASKAAAELVVSSWPKEGNTRIGTARAGNVIGGGDWSEDRLVPDLVRAWSVGETVALRMPEAVRPWQHVVQPLHGYLLYAEALANDAGGQLPAALNFGPESDQVVPVGTLAEAAGEAWEQHGGRLPAPATTVEGAATMVETEFLAIDSSLATASLGWHNVLDWRRAIDWTIEFYRSSEPASGLIAAQLDRYEEIVRG